MKQVDVKDQVRLSPAKVFELTISGIKYRLFRSAVTVATVALAVAFLMTMLSQSVLKRNVGVAVAIETAPRRNYDAWLARLDKPMSEKDLLAVLVAEPGDPNRLAEIRQWGQLGDAELARLKDLARGAEARPGEQEYLDYFARLDEGNRSLLLGPDVDRGSAIFETIQQPAQLQRFRDNLKHMPLPMPERLSAGLDSFLAEWAAARELRQRVLQGQAKAVASLAADSQGKRASQILAQADQSTVERLGRFGFRLTEQELPSLRRLAELEIAGEKTSRLLGMQSVRAALAEESSIAVSKVTERVLFDQAQSPKRAAELLRIARRTQVRQIDVDRLGVDSQTKQKLKEIQQAMEAGQVQPIEAYAGVNLLLNPAGAEQPLTAEAMSDVAGSRLAQSRLAEVAGKVEGEEAPIFLGFTRRTLWLIAVSFGVCAVGIANAMLMSVTERFREIATMKCLGAMDGFIMLLFVLESCLQGLAGGIMGAIVGLLLGLAGGWFEFASLAFRQVPFGPLTGCLGLSVVAGIVLAAGEAVYPAWVASRLAPMEAMRVE